MPGYKVVIRPIERVFPLLTELTFWNAVVKCADITWTTESKSFDATVETTANDLNFFFISVKSGIGKLERGSRVRKCP